MSEEQLTGLEIAVIGMEVKVPGASTIQKFWDNLKNGVESITFFTDRELEEAGIEPEELKNPNYIKANGYLEGAEYFDAGFFGYTPGEAEVMNPQLRLFQEYVWKTLEHAGYNPDTYEGLIGLYAGASPNFLWEAFSTFSGKTREVGQFAADSMVKEVYLSTRTSYKLNLTGPSFSFYTACSTSLVAIHLACQAILNGECEMALAGGVTITMESKMGYVYAEGMILSPDGHCRAFDAKSKGTVVGNGIGIVALKRLEDAINDGDHIYAVVKGSAINNDGIRKVAFSAPSVEGQAEAIRMAQQMAEFDPETISYIEAHGTGTVLGDPVEIEALKLAFNTDKKQYCAIGSVKTNVGHLDSAAGVTGFIKTALSLYHKFIPPSLHFETPNPKIDFENSPFFVNAQPKEWKAGDTRRRAGVSSFGIGGTNAHVVMEEWIPETGQQSNTPPREHQILLLSAKTKKSLASAHKNLGKFLKHYPDVNMTDAAYTLQVGRKHFNHRQAFVFTDREDALETLTTSGSPKIHRATAASDNRPVIFMFSGQGSQYVDMGRKLYETNPVFRSEMDHCFQVLKPVMEVDVKQILYPESKSEEPETPVNSEEPDTPKINQTEITQPVIFAVEYALAKLLMHWGISPYAMIGHSIGEYVAACLSGVFSLEDALKLVVLRGRLMQSVDPGSMLAISRSAAEISPRLEGKKDISMAAVNSPVRCVVSGPHQVMEDFQKELKEESIDSTLLHTSHAFHSSMMDSILTPFKEAVQKVALNKPELPYISNKTGEWITADGAVDPAYWSSHIRNAVLFSQGIDTLCKRKKNSVFIEVGPGKALSTFVQEYLDSLVDSEEDIKPDGFSIANLVRHPKEKPPDDRYLLSKIAQLWSQGVQIQWARFYGEDEKRHRIPLPTYTFEKFKYSLGGNILKMAAQILKGQGQAAPARTPIDQWFSVPSWEPYEIKPIEEDDDFPEEKETFRWLVFLDDTGFAPHMVRLLEQQGHQVIMVRKDKKYMKASDASFFINPTAPDSYDQLFADLKESDSVPRRILHLWSLTNDDSQEDPAAAFTKTQDLGFFSLLHIAQAIARQRISQTAIQLGVISNKLQKIGPNDEIDPGKATLLGPVKNIMHEYDNIRCRSVDICLPEGDSSQYKQLAEQLVTEFLSPSQNSIIAYRDGNRLGFNVKNQSLEKIDDQSIPYRKEGVYLILGGFGGMGLTMAEYLAGDFNARLILVGRSPIPEREAWSQWIDEHEPDDSLSQKIAKIQHLEEIGGKVLPIAADVADQEQMERIVTEAEETFGPINGVIHAAGVVDYGGVIQTRNLDDTRNDMASKVSGTIILDRLFKDKSPNPDFIVLCSSTNSILAPFGQVGYTAANAFLDAFAIYKQGQSPLTVTINWDAWEEVGMAVNAHKKAGRPGEVVGIRPPEGIEIFHRVIKTQLPQVAVDMKNLRKKLIQEEKELAREKSGDGSFDMDFADRPMYARPDLSSEYVAPETDLESKMAEVWQKFFGFEKVGVTDDFFELGGDSLKALAIIPLVKREIGLDIALSDVLLNPNIRGLTANCAEAGIVPTVSKDESAETTIENVIDAQQPSAEIEHSATGQEHPGTPGPGSTETTTPEAVPSPTPPPQKPEPKPVDPKSTESKTTEDITTEAKSSEKTASAPSAPAQPEKDTKLKSTAQLKANPLMRINRGKSDKNIFILHPLHGMVYQYFTLATLLENHYNVYALQARGMVGKAVLPDNMKIMAADYIKRIIEVQPEGPYFIIGYCFGDLMGYTLVRRLEDMGEKVSCFIMMDEEPFLPLNLVRNITFQHRMEMLNKPFKAIASLFSGKKANVHREELLKIAEEYERQQPTLTDSQLSPRDAEEFKKKAQFNISILNKQFWDNQKKTVPGIIQAPLVAIHAQNSPYNHNVERMKTFTTGKFQNFVVPGNHDSIFEPPNVQQVAQIILNLNK